MQLSEYENNSLKKLGESIHQGKWSNNGLVQLIELSGDFLNIKTIPDFSKQNNISYVAASKDTLHRKNITIFNTKFVIDNF